MVFPVDRYECKNKADQYFWMFMNEKFNFEIFSIHKTNDMAIDADAMLLVPNKGIIILAIKDYTRNSIISIIRNEMVRLRDRPIEYSGFLQAVKWREDFVKSLEQRVDGRIITAVVAYPFLSTSDYIEKGLAAISPEKLTFCADDIKDQGTFKNKIDDVFDYIYAAQDMKKEDIEFSLDHIKWIGERIDSNFGRFFIEQTEEHPIMKMDLRANSQKELYYGICSFLMKNGIFTGSIYSKSKYILDGLGTYMTSVKIPWCYGYAGEKTRGYRFIDDSTPEIVNGNEVIIDLNEKNVISVTQGNRKRYNIQITDNNSLYENLEEQDWKTPLHLKNEQIKRMFLKSFVVAEYEIDIISPWMNFGVVNEKFVELMEKALQRGVVVKILYGLEPDSSEYNLSRSNRSNQVAEFLKTRFLNFPGQLFIRRDNIHYKLVLCDEKFKLEGGYNYLSFMGDYDNEDTRKEGSPFGTNAEEIRFLRKEYFGDNEYSSSS